jgi:hypothetical protein
MQGYGFIPSTNLLLTALVFWDEGSNGLFIGFEIGLWETGSQTLLASAIIVSGDPLDATLVVDGGSWRYETLSSAVALSRGVDYTLAFHLGPVFLPSSESLFFDFASISTSPDLAVIDERRFLETRYFAIPTVVGSPAGTMFLANANALITVPESTTALLLAFGLVFFSHRVVQAG